MAGAEWKGSMYRRKKASSSGAWRDANTGGIYSTPSERKTGRMGEVEIRQEHVYAHDAEVGEKKSRHEIVKVWHPKKGYVRKGKVVRPHNQKYKKKR